MPESFTDHLDRHSFLDEKSPVSVADVVQTNAGYLGSGDNPLEGLRERMGMNRFALVVGEHPIDLRHSGDRMFSLLPVAPGCEDPQCRRIEVIS